MLERSEIVGKVMSQLRFSPENRVITFVPGTSMEGLAELAGPARRLARAVPLPAVAVADNQGAMVVHPGDEVATELFEALCQAVVVTDEHQFEALFAVTATMASFYAVLEAQASWLTSHGVPYASARAFLSAYSAGLASEANLSTRSFAGMIDDLMTPRGISE